MTRDAISSPGASSIGPYSHAVRAGRLVFLSGQTPIDPRTGAIIEGDAADQTRQCIENLAHVLRSAGLCMDDVVRCGVFLVDMADFQAMNREYQKHFAQPMPARTTVAVAALPLGARVEIEMVAFVPEPEPGPTARGA